MSASPTPLRHRHVAVQEADFDLSAEVALLAAGDGGAGAMVSFVGLVREWAADAGAQAQGGKDEEAPALVLEHYPGMTERSIDRLLDEAAGRFPIRGARIIHRVGRLPLGEQIVLVAVSAAHRHAAFQACEFLMDWLKTQAPFWKKEVTGGAARWVDARAQDDMALARWGGVPGAGANVSAAGKS